MSENLNVGEFTPRQEIDQRLDGLRQRMADQGISFAVILQNVDLFYFTGTIQKGVLVVPTDQAPLFFVEKSLVRAEKESPLDIIPIKRDKDVKEMLNGKGVIKGMGGMELDVVPVALFERWKSILGHTDFTDVSPLIKDVRQIKSDFEIAQIIKSGRIISQVFQKAKGVIKEGLREIDIDAALIAEGRRAGHQGFLRMRGLNQEMMNGYVTQGYSGTVASGADVPISGFGLSPAISQGSSINVVKRGIPVVVDYGGGYNGYITDETRIYAAGELKEHFRRGYQVSRQIVEETMRFGREGVDATEIFVKAMELAKEAKLDAYFMGHGEGKVNFVGHGLGLEINELPVITPRHKTILKEGMVFAFEPKFIFPDEGAVGLEVDFIVRKRGLERVTDFSPDIQYV
ncbi:MAG TPA: Xaa-Pro peptidase family protein [Syntrophorhabdaceae bacterium]|nr:Xaa-Pro peptidase family protein [Syntrophorhabdaceae bacterium]